MKTWKWNTYIILGQQIQEIYRDEHKRKVFKFYNTPNYLWNTEGFSTYTLRQK